VISLLAEEPLAVQEGHCSIEFVRFAGTVISKIVLFLSTFLLVLKFITPGQYETLVTKKQLIGITLFFTMFY
jgi:hypothetical protein